MIWNLYDAIVGILCFICLIKFMFSFIKKENITDGIWTLISLNVLMYLLLK
jgi:hypothetical protein